MAGSSRISHDASDESQSRPSNKQEREVGWFCEGGRMMNRRNESLARTRVGVDSDHQGGTVNHALFQGILVALCCIPELFILCLSAS
jgi:hypothetical protein